MTRLGNLLYFLMIWAAIGALASIGGTIWGLWWLFTHISIAVL
jgi:hypothetical protein